MSKDRIAFALKVAALTLMMAFGRVWGAPENPLDASSDPFAGSYAGDRLYATFTASGGGGYTGQIKLGDKTYPIQARQNGAAIQGKFSSGADDFQFTATLNGQELVFSTGTSRYTLKRVEEKVNPLDAPPSAAPPAIPASAPAGDNAAGAADVGSLPDVPLPKGFSELGSTPSGRSIFSNFTDIRSIDDLIQHVGDALGVMFGAKPQFGSACVDARNKNGGVATFSATLKGTPIKGLVLFGVNPQGASSATVIYTRPSTPSEEFMTLMQTVPAQPKMHTRQMPDGSGSIDIPEGWTCLSQSLTAGPIRISGPKSQFMAVGLKIRMVTPDSVWVQNAKRNHDSAVNLYRLAPRGAPPKPLESYLADLMISPHLSPEDAVTKVLPQLNAKNRNAGKPWAEYGEMTVKQKVPPIINTSEAEIIGSSLKAHDGDKTEAKRVMMKVEIAQPDQTGAWNITIDQYIAPDATAASDFPLMAQVYTSINIPQAAVQRQLDKDNKAFQNVCAYYAAKNDALLERGREFQANQKEQFERFEQQQAAQAQARHDACSDMIESSLGVRDVLDTATGQMHKVDLYNSTAITDTLNGLANDPSRFVQIPLRYER